MVALRRAAGDSCRRVAAFLQANVAAAVLQVVLVAAAFVASKRLNSWYRLHSAPFSSCTLQDCSYGGAIDANAMVRVPVFVAFWACFVSRVRPPSGPDRQVGALR